MAAARRTKPASIILCLAAAALGAAGLVSCAGNPALARGAEPERLLPGGALAYAKLDRYVLEAFIDALGIEGAEAAAQALSARTDSLVLALLPAAAPLPGAMPALLAVASGRYPSGAAALKLNSDKAWIREGSVWRQKEGELRLGFAGGATLLLGTRALDGMSAAIRNPGPNPIPGALACGLGGRYSPLPARASRNAGCEPALRRRRHTAPRCHHDGEAGRYGL